MFVKVTVQLEIEEISIEKKVKDFKFFNGEEVKLPYEAHHTIKTNEEAKEIFDKSPATIDCCFLNVFTKEFKTLIEDKIGFKNLYLNHTLLKY